MPLPGPAGLPAPIVATLGDLPPAVRSALSAPATGEVDTVTAGGMPFALRAWGERAHAPLLLLHGVTSSSSTWWRIAPALAATGRRVIAVDLPGHGRTQRWTGRHRFDETARDVVAFAGAAGLVRPDLSVIGHSWGAVTAAHLPSAGLRPERLVLLDPPALPVSVMAALTVDPVERHYDDRDEAIRAVGTANPTWSYGDVVAKAEALTEFDDAAVRAVLVANGDWDGGLDALGRPAAAGLAVWIVRGDPTTGGYLPDDRLPGLVARVGAERLLTIAGAPHSPHRTHPEATLAALLRALA